MAEFQWNVEGVEDLVNELTRRLDALTPNVGKEMYQWAEGRMSESKERVPVDTGALLNSGYVKPPEVVDGVVTVELGYGGQSVDYAATVHENMDPHVRWKRPGSGPKFLENPITEGQGELLQDVADVVRSTIAG